MTIYSAPRSLLSLFARERRRRTLVYLGAAVPLAVAIIFGGREIAHHMSNLEAWIDKLGPWGVLAFVALFIGLTSLLLPDTVLCIAAGALFGVGLGIGTIAAGAFLAATLQFALSRKLLRAKIERTLAAKPSFAAIQNAVSQDEFRLQLLLRLTPLNPATMSYLLGAAGVRFGGFFTACVALLPNLALGVYFGHAGKHATRLAGDSAREAHLHNLAVFGGLATGIVVMFFVSKIARASLAQAITESETPPAP